MTSVELAMLAFQKHIDGRDLVWCEGMAGWLPLGATLSANDGPQKLEVVDGIAAPRAERQTAQRVLSLSQLYLDNLQRANIPLPPPLIDRPAVRRETRPLRSSGSGRHEQSSSAPVPARSPDHTSGTFDRPHQGASIRSPRQVAPRELAPAPAMFTHTFSSRGAAMPDASFSSGGSAAASSTTYPTSATPHSGTALLGSQTLGVGRQMVPAGAVADDRPSLTWKLPSGRQDGGSTWVQAISGNARTLAARSLIAMLDRYEIHTFDDLASNARLDAISAGVYDCLPLSVRTVIASTLGRGLFESQLRELLNSVRARVDPAWRQTDPREMVLYICSEWLEAQIAQTLTSGANAVASSASAVASGANRLVGYFSDLSTSLKKTITGSGRSEPALIEAPGFGGPGFGGPGYGEPVR